MVPVRPPRSRPRPATPARRPATAQYSHCPAEVRVAGSSLVAGPEWRDDDAPRVTDAFVISGHLFCSDGFLYFVVSGTIWLWLVVPCCAYPYRWRVRLLALLQCCKVTLFHM